MRFYFMGICGTAMGNAARLLKTQGHEVCGSDTGIYPPMSEVLEQAAIEVYEGFSAERLSKLEIDHVVVGNAISRGNEEVEWLLNQSKLVYGSLPQLFSDSILMNRQSIVVTGTHGKTTTATIAAFLLERSGADPGWLIGGVPNDLHSGAKLGKGSAFVIEGDEYDSAFFDKRSKFIHYRPQIAILGNLEFDHADIFRDLEDVQRSFQHLLRIIPSSGYAIINGDEDNITALLPAPWTQVIRVGEGPNNDLIVTNFVDGPEGSSFTLQWKGVHWAQINWSMHGFFNARNAAMAALAAALASGHEDPTAYSLRRLSTFRGVQRRQDVLLFRNDWVIIEDFAHHPTAINAAIKALRVVYPKRQLCACFEPRSNTATKAIFQEAFTAALSQADTIFIGGVHRAENIEESNRLKPDSMAKDLIMKGRDAAAFSTNQQLLDYLKDVLHTNSNGVIVFFTNGSFDNIQHEAVAYLKTK
ncbi:MAG: Mur ligase domain-containing protein [Puniceicoccaceae bacterium]|nr:Mur ligase domain-containing protein [Puniceicoccaceae bacterium]